MIHLSLVHLIIFAIVALILFGNRLPTHFQTLKKAADQLRQGVAKSFRRGDPPPVKVELVTASRNPTMKERFNKFLWTPHFWALLGVIGCSTGLYFQRVASNGAGLWCLGLIFLGAAYLENNP